MIDTTDDDRLRQTRLAWMGRSLVILGAAYLAVTTITTDAVFRREVVAEIIGTIAFGTLWLALRKRPRSARFIATVELASLGLGACAFASLALVLPLADQPESGVRGALTFLLLGYAAWVPSNTKRTLLVALLMTMPLFGCVYFAYARAGASPLDATFSCATWWIVAVAIAVSFSRTIYGLRRKVCDIQKLGQYTLEEKLGEGGMGVVYRASHAMLRRPTAVKLLLPDRAGKDSLARFEREVRRTAMLTHPNTVTVFDYGRTTEGIFYYAMELLEGATLHDVVEIDGPQPPARVIHLLDQAAGSLAEAHAAGLIHRDIEPGNILVVDRGGIPDLVKVVDFGLVKDVGPTDAADDRTVEAPLTAANTITGTPLYLAPETLTTPEMVDARADIYALGAVAYWLLTGTHVFNGRSVMEVCGHHMHTKPESPAKRLGASVSADLEALVLACLANAPADRPASADVLRERLRACRDAGTWTTARAAEWWQARAAAVAEGRKMHAGSVDALGATMMVSVTRAAS